MIASRTSTSRPHDTGTKLVEFKNPAGPGSGRPFLSAAPNGSTVLSWLEPVNERDLALRFSIRKGDEWSEPRTVATSHFFNHHAAVLPAVRVLANGSLVSYWTHRGEFGPESEEVYSAISSDGGLHWSKPVILHQDSSRTEHSLVSMTSIGNEASIVWLEERRSATNGSTALMQRSWRSNGTLGPEITLDGDVCDCCPTASGVTAKGIIVAYRDHTPDNIRDISIVRREKNRWTKPRLLHSDNWHINGCPANAADLATNGDQKVVVAWFTAPNDKPHVNMAFSDDAGDTFSEPIAIDNGQPGGRASVALLPDGSAVVSWLERSPAKVQLLVRYVAANRHIGSVTTVVFGDPSALGYPRITSAGDQAILAWTERGTSSSIHTAFVSAAK